MQNELNLFTKHIWFVGQLRMQPINVRRRQSDIIKLTEKQCMRN